MPGSEEEKAVKAVIFSRELKRRETELSNMKKKGINDPQKELIVKTLRTSLARD